MASTITIREAMLESCQVGSYLDGSQVKQAACCYPKVLPVNKTPLKTGACCLSNISNQKAAVMPLVANNRNREVANKAEPESSGSSPGRGS